LNNWISLKLTFFIRETRVHLQNFLRDRYFKKMKNI